MAIVLKLTNTLVILLNAGPQAAKSGKCKRIFVVGGQDSNSPATPHNAGMSARWQPLKYTSRPMPREAYLCASCLFKSLPGRAREGLRRNSAARAQSEHARAPARPQYEPINRARQYSTRTFRRHASNGTLASSTAINAPSTVPPAYRELYERLRAVRDVAGSLVELSRLQLAARSLETDTPVIRVAFHGLGVAGARAARKLARALLADALGPEEAWEKSILESVDEGRSLVLKYGDVETAAQSHALVRTLHVPSSLLQRNKLEVLITTLDTSNVGRWKSYAELEEALLTPPLSTPNSAGSGRAGFVTYPVHKALIVAEGVSGAVELGRLPDGIASGGLIDAALCLQLRSNTGGPPTGEATATRNMIDIDLASHALSLFRANNANGAQFSDEWETSGLSRVSAWLSNSSIDSGHRMNPAVRRLLAAMLSSTIKAVERAEAEHTLEALKATVTDFKRNDLRSAISTWSEEAHADLQIHLNAALISKTWKRTAWWRLFWRIDDVSVAAGDVLRRSWLTEAQQMLVFLSGRIYEAGLTTDELEQTSESSKGKEAVDHTKPKDPQVWTSADLLPTSAVRSRIQEQTGVDLNHNPAWPQAVHLSRQQLLHTLVPLMHAKAQGLLLTLLTTIGGTAALGFLTYVATAGVAVYEAGAIAALGLVWSVSRLQRLWNKERDRFATTLRENGRRVLMEVDRHLRRVVDQGGRVRVRPEDARSWTDARRAVNRCAEALASIK